MPHNIIRAISKSGLCSRRQALGLVMAGKVRVKGRAILDPGTKISDPGTIFVNGKPLPKVKKRYILFHKPSGYMTTRDDELGRPTVYEFLKDIDDWIFPVGRLDRDSEGLLIFTNDTKFGNILTEPRYKIERTYEVLIDGAISQGDIQKMLKGVDIGRGEKARPVSVKALEKEDGGNWIRISLQGGKNREIRRLFEHFGRSVKRLIRIKYGPYSLGAVKPGRWMEVKKLIIALLLILTAVAPSYAQPNQHPIKNIIKKVRAFFRPSPFALWRKQIQKAYDEDRISKQDYNDQMDDVDKQEEAARELKQQLAEQRAQAAALQAGN